MNFELRFDILESTRGMIEFDKWFQRIQDLVLKTIFIIPKSGGSVVSSYGKD